jgi:translation initiation factor 1
VNRKRSADENSVVWSSETGRTPPAAERREGTSPTRPAGDGVVRLGRESKGRRGKTVTVISGLLLSASELDDLARDLKRRCGTGGTVRDDVVEIQGDQREIVAAELARRGWTVKRVGG